MSWTRVDKRYLIFIVLPCLICCPELWPALYNDFVKSLCYYFAYSIYIYEPKINFLEEQAELKMVIATQIHALRCFQKSVRQM